MRQNLADVCEVAGIIVMLSAAFAGLLIGAVHVTTPPPPTQPPNLHASPDDWQPCQQAGGELVGYAGNGVTHMVQCRERDGSLFELHQGLNEPVATRHDHGTNLSLNWQHPDTLEPTASSTF